MDMHSFNFYKDFLHKRSGLAITEEKIYLLETRLACVMRMQGFTSMEELTSAVRMNQSGEVANAVINAMTTNETLFFRDGRPFNYFKDTLLPQVIEQRAARKSLRVWSAACSTGQEPYSIAMLIKERLKGQTGWNNDILATDIADHALEQAKRGHYSHFEVQRGLPVQYLMQHFKSEEQNWIISDEIKNMVNFKKFNLLDGMSQFGQFDIIFCRNVLIYFDEETKKDVLTRMAKCLAPDGYLFLGGSETIISGCTSLKSFPECPGLFTLNQEELGKATTPTIGITTNTHNRAMA